MEIRLIENIIGRDPWKWEVKYDMMGWSITASDSEFSRMLSEEEAMRYIQAIKLMKIEPKGTLP